MRLSWANAELSVTLAPPEAEVDAAEFLRG
jgi:hypothetical protein